ncbi:toprim domain-containing protein [Undibacterium sp.]|uniref:toprim domain-containing protein n=1 Tax=Undibacterium sp. TaxID=1914977 RepID=UPI002730356E|nr:toprim domain-containing protein [Undibacterium sp.]MDP1979234.1 toprim domain-containing protein [Undibacterium sp.]
MDESLRHEILQRLVEFKFKPEQNGMLRGGICPACQKKELYINAEHPWVIRCGRLNNCGETRHVKELYPDLFDNWSERYKPTPEKPNPNAAADAYMQHGRGFALAKVQGMYTQEYYFDQELKIGSATVRFPFGNGYWERIIDQPYRFGKKKAHFKYGSKYYGLWWKPDPVVIQDKTEIWLVEGVFDALALMHHDIPAVALGSCNNYPEEALRNLAASRGNMDCRLVWALDGDNAGRSYTKKHVDKARAAGWECAAAQIPQDGKNKLDWNDAHQRDALTEKDIEEYRYHGDLLLAKSAEEKALLRYKHDGGQTEFYFDFGNRLFWFRLDLERYNKAREQQDNSEDSKTLSEYALRDQALVTSSTVYEIANCLPRALYFQENLITNESWYYFRVSFPHDGKPVKNTFTASQIACSAEFNKRLLGMAGGAMYNGSSNQLKRILADQLYNIKRVDTIDYIGYSLEHGCYVLGDVAMKDGVLNEVNSEDFFDIGKLSIKSLNKSVNLTINRDRHEYRTDWLDLIWTAFGAKGLVALTFWFGSLFAEQIRSKQSSYPFLEVVGEAGAGKSTLIEFLWKLFGRNGYEGFDPAKSSLAARARNFGQVSCLPVVLIESDRERMGEDKSHVKSFDWDELKTAYNGRSMRARGMATGGNETYEPPFRGSIVISQNNPVNASEAILSRIVHLYFDRSTQTAASGEAADKLKYMSVEQVSGFILAATKREKAIMELVGANTPLYLKELRQNKNIKMPRLVETHAQMLALADALALVVKLPESQQAALKAQIVTMAEERQQVINSDHVLVQEFWEAFDYLDNGDMSILNHSRDPGFIAVNLNHFMQVATEKRQQVPLLRDLKKVLKTSSRRKFVETNRVVNSVIRSTQSPMATPSTSVKCWIFQTEK